MKTSIDNNLCCLGTGMVPVPDTSTDTGYDIFRKSTVPVR
jgi:hypothetical protein